MSYDTYFDNNWNTSRPFTDPEINQINQKIREVEPEDGYWVPFFVEKQPDGSTPLTINGDGGYWRSAGIGTWMAWLEDIMPLFADNPLNGVAYWHDDGSHSGVIRIANNVLTFANEYPVFDLPVIESETYKLKELSFALSPFVKNTELATEQALLLIRAAQSPSSGSDANQG